MSTPIDGCRLEGVNCYEGAFQTPVLLTEPPPLTRFTPLFGLKFWKHTNTGVEPGYSVTALEVNKRKEVNKSGGGRDRLSYQRL